MAGAAGHLGGQLGAAGFGELFEHDVHVQAADAEGVDAGAARQAVGLLGPRRGLLRNVERRLVPIDLGIERLNVDRRHEGPVLHAQHGLDHARQRRPLPARGRCWP